MSHTKAKGALSSIYFNERCPEADSLHKWCLITCLGDTGTSYHKQGKGRSCGSPWYKEYLWKFLLNLGVTDSFARPLFLG